ncbi:MAG: type II secretion system protein, partial [Planctomycetes bacterium]|nr:type II secretion system protein [Planctomycetota bacterium]
MVRAKVTRGFTLVELLVVIAIMALLMAILMPALGRARQAAYSSVCLGNVRRISMAAQIYVTDQIYFPPH